MDPNALYEFNVDNDGDAVGDKTFGGLQGYTDHVTALHNSGKAYNDITLSSCPSGAQDACVFVGQRAELFSVNLGQIVDLVNFDPTTFEDSNSNNQLADKNIIHNRTGSAQGLPHRIR